MSSFTAPLGKLIEISSSPIDAFIFPPSLDVTLPVVTPGTLVGVLVGVDVFVDVAVGVGVLVDVSVGVGVFVGVLVAVWVGVAVGVGTSGKSRTSTGVKRKAVEYHHQAHQDLTPSILRHLFAATHICGSHRRGQLHHLIDL